MKKIKELLMMIEVRTILKPMVMVILLSFVYNYAYMCLSLYRAVGPSTLITTLQVLLSLLSALGFYWICTAVWTQRVKKFSIYQGIMVLLGQGVLICVVSGLLGNFYAYAIDHTNFLLVEQLLSALVLISWVPLQLLYYYALFLGKKGKDIFIYMFEVLKKKQKTILNWYCALLILIIVIDTLTQGAFSILHGFDAYSILFGTVYLGNPMVQWMMSLLWVANMELQTVFTLAFEFFVIGVFYMILELNYIRFIQRKCYEYESQSH